MTLMMNTANVRRLCFAIIFAILSVSIAAATLQSLWSVTGLCESWLAANLIALSIAYFMNWPGVFGKTSLGTLRLVSALFMAPMLLIIRFLWMLQNAILRPPLYDEIAPDLFVGRICGYQSLPQGVTLLIDLTSEFPTPRSIRTKVPFICLPTLDGCPPDMTSVRRCFELIGTNHQRVYVCCANGYGRSVTLMAAWLGYSGRSTSVNDAVKLIQASRSKAAPNQDQMSFLTEVFRSISP